MNKPLIWLLLSLSITYTIAAPKSTSPTDTIAPDYVKAVDLCLFHQFTDAEKLLKQIIQNEEHPNREAARYLLLEDVYFRRNQYQAYVRFCDSTAYRGYNLSEARLLASQPLPSFSLPADSIQLPIRVRKWPIVTVLIHGKPYRFIIDTGAERTTISKHLAARLQAKSLLNTSVNNSLHQAVSSVFTRIDSLQIGELIVRDLPVWQTSMTGFPADGLLGWDVLQQFRFTIDYKAQQLSFRKPIFLPTATRNLLGIGRLLLLSQSDIGNQLDLFLDTGSNAGISLTPVGISKIGPYQKGSRLGAQLGLGGRFKIRKEQTVKQTIIHMGPHVLNLRKAPIERSNELICSVLKDGTVGSGQFRKGRLTIDYLNNHFDYDE
ncbi:retropepsin-like aspartic protease [Spirosoma panaciterrae]|uniref:retropepsin-like aspartic protease n=1 Tax=Spirosoma panaciterrae TaxID=496058 RepID=UPI00039EAC54|nr:retropepsin-like aspartic protease [Spirosoma panaciterrae]